MTPEVKTRAAPRRRIPPGPSRAGRQPPAQSDSGDRPAIQYHLVSFEGPDAYARAGGIASRVTGLAEALAEAGFETHLWFVGDPDVPGHEERGGVHLHRWCQWISRYHEGGVYDGEDVKQSDFTASLPAFLLREHLLPGLTRGGRAVILAEEWHTADAVIQLDRLLRQAGHRDRVSLLWNANNTFGFEYVPWERLRTAATITTVSRFMRQEMWQHGVDALVIPNGIPTQALQPPDSRLVTAMEERFQGRLVLTKVARWDPDKRWLLAMDTVAELKRQERRPLLIARGGMEPHGRDVLAHAAATGLKVAHRTPAGTGGSQVLDALTGLDDSDVVDLRTPLSPEAGRVLFRASAAVLANSRREPFGLVGLESMATGGVTCVGGTGEEYAVPGWNALLLQTEDPREFLAQFAPLDADPRKRGTLRRRAIATAQRFGWPEILQRNLLPAIRFVGERAHRWVVDPCRAGPHRNGSAPETSTRAPVHP